MMKRGALYFCLLIISAAGCGRESIEKSAPETAATFFEKSPQAVANRVVLAELQPLQSVYLDSLNISSPNTVRLDDNYIYISESAPITVTVISKHDLSLVRTISFTEGSGLGELSEFADFDVSSNAMALLDGNAHKVVITGLDGIPSHEIAFNSIRPSRLAFLDEDHLILLSENTNNYIMNVVNLDGEFIHRFIEIESPDSHNPYQFRGRVVATKDHLYFAGRAESILKKYTKEGALLFTKTTIDDLPSEHNYITFPAGGDGTPRGYSPGVLWSFFDVDVWDHHIITAPHHNSNPQFTLLDIYSSKNGEYEGTLFVEDRPFSVAADDKYLYVAESRGGVRTLKKYPNNLREWITGK